MKKKGNLTSTFYNSIANFQPCRCLSEVISDKDIFERDYIGIQGLPSRYDKGLCNVLINA